MKKRFLSILLALSLCLTLLPTAVLADTGDSHSHCICGGHYSSDSYHTCDSVSWTKWESADSLPTERGNYYLTKDVTLEDEWELTDGTALCLNGHNITMDRGIAVITVRRGINFTLTDCKGSSNQGKLSHSMAPTGYQRSGNGVTVYGGTFSMYGGNITGNEVSNGGGGVEVSNSNTYRGCFNMYGGTIFGNTVTGSNSGGGVYVEEYGNSFTMYGGTISGNSAAKNGGGVYIKATSQNYTSTFKMYGGTISNNTPGTGSSGGNGGGVYVDGYAKFLMYGNSSISGNTAPGHGGGVYVDTSASFEMFGGSITENEAGTASDTASGTGGGVYAGNSFKIYGNSSITNNTVHSSANNVYLPNGKTIQVNSDGNFTGSVGISVQTLPTSVYAPVTVLTCTDSNVTSLTNTCNYLSVDAGSRYSVNANGELVMTPCATHLWSLQDNIYNCTDCGYYHKSHCECNQCRENDETHTCNTDITWIPVDFDLYPAYFNGNSNFGHYSWKISNNTTYYLYLTKDVTVQGDGSALKVGNKKIYICLNGHTIKTDKGTTFQASSQCFTITDCIGSGTIQYTGSGTGRCFDGDHNASFTMYGGTITGFTNGAVECQIFTMYGGSITKNSRNGDGGAVHTYGGGSMYGGSITQNTATGNGGGVYCDLYKTSGRLLNYTFNLYGGSISENKATNGGGVYCNELSMSGGSITKNTATGDGGGVYCTTDSSSPGNGGIIRMTNGTISGNTATSNGGGAYISSSVNGNAISGSITGNCANTGGGVYFNDVNNPLTLSGNAIIQNNTSGSGANASANNLFLYQDEDKYYAKIVVDDDLSTDSRIGISTTSAPLENAPIPISDTTGSSVAGRFFSDNDSYYVAGNSTGGLQLTNIQVSSITVTGDDTISVPNKGTTIVSTTPSVMVKDNNQNTVTGVTVTWACTADLPTGVTLDSVNGALTVDHTAQSSTVQVYAQYGTVKSNTITYTITRAGSVATSVTVTVTNSTSLEPVTEIDAPTFDMNQGTTGSSVCFPCNATIYDQYGEIMSGQNIDWTLIDETGSGTGIYYENGLVVCNTANEGTVKVKATVNGRDVTGETSIQIKKNPRYGAYVRIFKEETETETEIETDSIQIPVSGKPSIDVTYTAKVYDQYAVPFEDSETCNWSLNVDNSAAVTITDTPSTTGTLTVSASAVNLFGDGENEHTITLTATSSKYYTYHNTAIATLSITLKKQNPVEVTIENVGTKTYGDDDFTMTASVPEGTAAGSWSWTSSNPSVLNITGGSDTATPTVAIVGAGNATLQATYSGETVIGSWSLYIHVDKKELKADDLEFTTGSTFTKTYDGTTACTTATVQIKDTAKVKSSDELPTPNGSCVYDSADVSATKVTFTTKSSNNSNYTLPRLTLEKSASIAPAPLTFTATAEDRAYNGKSDVTIESVAFSGLQNGEGLTEDTDYTVSAVLAEGEDVNASKTPKNVTVTVTLTDSNKAKNYALASDTCTTTVTISRAKYSGTTEITHSYYYGELGQVPLRNYLVPDVDKVTIKDKTDAGEILDYAEVSKNNNLLFRFKADAAPGKTATVTLHVTSKQNYEPYDIIVTLYVLDKQTQTVQLDSYTEEAVYGDDSFTVTASNNVGNTVSYSSSDPSVATVDSETGEVTIVGAGETVITATAAETLNYKEAKAEYTLKVHKAPLTITAVDQGSYTGTALPEMEYTVSGLVNGDTLETAGISFTMYYAQDGETVDSPSSAGTYDIMFSGAAESANYEITYVSGTLTLRRNMLPLIIGGAAIADASKDRPDFADVPVNAYYADAVAWAADEGITGGVDETHFAPNQSCTRAQTVTFLWRAAGSPEPKSTVMPFADVPANAYYYKAVLWAVENSITTGVTERTFCPDSTCTRVQIVTFLFRYAISQGMEAVTMQELVSGYTDAAHVPGYALSAFNWAIAQGIVQGSNGKLLPDVDCSRAQIVTMLYRLLNK